MSQPAINYNRYPGVNPHLNSALQQEGWKGFHTLHLSDIGDVIESALPAGYYTSTEPSLQITARNDRTRTEPDILIYRRSDSPPVPARGTGSTLTPTLVIPLVETEFVEDIEEEFVSSVVIYHDKTPITRIELLSPANKHPGSHHPAYLEKRDATLKSGICLVEIDYLHERYPVIHGIPSYPDRHPKAHPYCIVVSDPRPSLYDGRAEIFGIGILTPLPVLELPLAGNDVVSVDFGAAYQKTFNRRKEFYEVFTDYTRTPPHFTAYSPTDQALILQHMAKIATQP